MAENIIEMRVSESPVCDFCSSAEPRFLEDALSFTATEIENTLYTHSEGAWASCKACHALIQARKWNQLERRAIIRLKRKHPDVPLEVIANGVHTEHVRFRAHQT